MYNDIYEVVSSDSNTINLIIHEDDYFLSYDNLNKENVKDLVENYFRFKGRDGIPVVADIDYNAATRRIQITVDMDYDRDFKMKPMSTPDILNINRYD
ncbi:hypothetical protein [Clostridium thermarum]|uniref:hypothetical protein n=1 Tax=Clostridium thermarum TaxID=1716543 RepID=UPI0013D43F88|nr:hypothetical protein [Clostridium thermarum]